MKEKARHLRSNQTDVERKLWCYLRDRRMSGCKFRRQHPVGQFIVDFACLERNLIVEVDGGQHAKQIEEDTARTKYLESLGFRVVRFWNNEVLGEIDVVLEVIYRALGPHADPAPRPPAGEGEKEVNRSIKARLRANDNRSTREQVRNAKPDGFPVAGDACIYEMVLKVLNSNLHFSFKFLVVSSLHPSPATLHRPFHPSQFTVPATVSAKKHHSKPRRR